MLAQMPDAEEGESRAKCKGVVIVEVQVRKKSKTSNVAHLGTFGPAVDLCRNFFVSVMAGMTTFL